jgi:flavin reductase (DIM6/NTAB) family NADH-FMN oxidoreductase RutF
MTVDPREYRRTIGLFATGVTVITAEAQGRIHGMTANSVTSVSLDPLLLLVCIDRRATMCSLIHAAGRFAVNILSEGQEPLSRHFAGRSVEGLEVRFGQLAGTPVVPGALAQLACGVRQLLDGGDHVIVIGAVEAIQRAHEAVPPLVYFAGGYCRLAAAHD